MSHQVCWKFGPQSFFRKPFFVVGFSFPYLGIEAVRAVGLGKQFFGKWGVSGLDFHLKPGRLTALLGPNGAGKTTSMRLLAGFFRANQGYMEVEGKVYQTLPKGIREKIAYLPENGPVYRDLSVQESLWFFAKAKGIPSQQINRALTRMMEELDLGDVRNKLVATLSKGFRQRLALASTLLGDPDYLFLDEPSYGLDPIQIGQVHKIIKNLSKDKTVLISTHSLSEVEEICDDVIILSEGRMLANNSVEELKRKDKVFIQTNQDYDTFLHLLKSAGFSELKLISKSADSFFRYEVSLNDKKIEELYLLCSENKILVRELQESEESLKKIFKEITNK
ncbi:ABC transporter ATP-binding protein [Leptospira ryugenii]|uniref:ABC transporter ATP-binding protein n=1 Tax=Leptospira ryugenii TaxID=1917863 RepID=UPI000D5A018B|nr:ABC transporter ATP-binding protein [Leptospira ryugenii]